MEFLADIQATKYPIRLNPPSLIILHRCDFAKDDPPLPSVRATYKDLLERFADTRPNKAGSYTGGVMPYHFVVEQTGRVVQVAKIMSVLPHARKWSTGALGVVVLGDWRSAAVPAAQWEATISICSALVKAGYGANGIKGHTDMPGGSKDPTKICPGKHLNPGAIALAVRSFLAPNLNFG